MLGAAPRTPGPVPFNTMKSPLEFGPLKILDSTPSTQDVAAEIVRSGEQYGGVLAFQQTSGRGRFQREWSSPKGESLSLSLIFRDLANSERPWLVGMACAIATASAVHGRLQWPNDVILDGKKVAGILSELVKDAQGHLIPVVGIGVNVLQAAFPPELAEKAISLKLHRPTGSFDIEAVAKSILERIETLPDPTDWESLRPAWMLFDSTPGKRYELMDGSQAIGIGIGPNGELICSIDGETQSVMAADAIFGSDGLKIQQDP